MQKNLIYLLFFLSLLGCKQPTAKIKSPPAQQVNTAVSNTLPTVKMEMTIEGMMCAIGCAATIEKKLNATAGITAAAVDFESKKAQLNFDQTLLTPIAIQTIVTDISDIYSISEFSVSN